MCRFHSSHIQVWPGKPILSFFFLTLARHPLPSVVGCLPLGMPALEGRSDIQPRLAVAGSLAAQFVHFLLITSHSSQRMTDTKVLRTLCHRDERRGDEGNLHPPYPAVSLVPCGVVCAPP